MSWEAASINMPTGHRSWKEKSSEDPHFLDSWSSLIISVIVSSIVISYINFGLNELKKLENPQAFESFQASFHLSSNLIIFVAALYLALVVRAKVTSSLKKKIWVQHIFLPSYIAIGVLDTVYGTQIMQGMGTVTLFLMEIIILAIPIVVFIFFIWLTDDTAKDLDKLSKRFKEQAKQMESQ